MARNQFKAPHTYSMLAMILWASLANPLSQLQLFPIQTQTELWHPLHQKCPRMFKIIRSCLVKGIFLNKYCYVLMWCVISLRHHTRVQCAWLWALLANALLHQLFPTQTQTELQTLSSPQNSPECLWLYLRRESLLNCRDKFFGGKIATCLSGM